MSMNLKLKRVVEILLIAPIFFLSFSTYAQSDTLKRTLKIWEEVEDNELSTEVYIGYHKDDRIKYCYQTRIGKSGDVVKEMVEDYDNKGFWKYWTVTYSHTKKKLVKKRNMIGKSYDSYEAYYKYKTEHEYDMEGKLIYFEEWKNDKKTAFHLFEYYPNGKIKNILEYKGDLLWNVLDHRYPDGTKHTMGDFKNGTGIVYPLNNEGLWCEGSHFKDGKEIKD